MIPAAHLFTLLSLIVALFQAALVLGAPWGALTWGGAYPGTLPPAMRGAALVSLGLMLAFTYVVQARAGRFGPEVRQRHRRTIWGVVGYCVVGVVANAATPSVWERRIWLPTVTLMCLSSLRVATAAGRPPAD